MLTRHRFEHHKTIHSALIQHLIPNSIPDACHTRDRTVYTKNSILRVSRSWELERPIQ